LTFRFKTESRQINCKAGFFGGHFSSFPSPEGLGYAEGWAMEYLNICGFEGKFSILGFSSHIR
jgi:hypothetical protein